MRIGVRKADDHNGPIDDFLIDIALFDLDFRICSRATVAICDYPANWRCWCFQGVFPTPNHRHFAIIILAWGRQS